MGGGVGAFDGRFVGGLVGWGVVGGGATTEHLHTPALKGQLQIVPSKTVPMGHVVVARLFPPWHCIKPKQSVEGYSPVAPGGHVWHGGGGGAVGLAVGFGVGSADSVGFIDIVGNCVGEVENDGA